MIDPKKVKLQLLQNEVENCFGCSLAKTRHKTVFAKGNPDSYITFIGEAAGEQEDLSGIPFVGRAGQLLNNMIKAMQLDPAEVYICNILKCRPPNNRKPLPDEVQSCSGFLKQQLEIVSPKVIVALGATAVEGLLGLEVGITKRRGIWGSYNNIPVMPTFHPAACLRNPELKKDVWSDLQKVMAFLKDISST